MITRRQAVSGLAWAAAGARLRVSSAAPKDDAGPRILPMEAVSPERIALIQAFKKQCEWLDKKFEARTHKGGWVMPYRLFRPEVSGKLPLVVYLHGSGGLGNDNVKQLALGNIFGTRVWLLPNNQAAFPCFVLAPQTDRGWIRFDPAKSAQGMGELLPGLGEGGRMALEVIDRVCHDFTIDDRRIYIMGQSMGGAGTWNIMANRPGFFAAAVACCASISMEKGAESLNTPLWNFHGASDKTVPVSVSRERMAARRAAGGRPIYTEYAGVDHNVWEWAFTEPALVSWLFSRRRA